ncbi:MAG: ABC transporter permease [Deltaproteobacteria bacterium]|nr:ABC transporter permease [Deltaproteobacteria bacterium]
MGDLWRETLRSLAAHKLRFALTASGIVWGIWMLTFLSAYMHGSDVHFAKQMTKIGQKVVFLFPGSVRRPGVGERASRPVELELDDVARIQALESVDAAGTNLFLQNLVVRANGRTRLVWAYGATEHTASIRNFDLGAGRFPSRRDVDEAARVVFLGAGIAKRLFGNRPAVGERVLIESIPFRVIGVSAEKGKQLIFSGPPDDLAALVPITTARRWFSKNDNVGQILFAPTTREAGWEAIPSVRGLLGVHHDFRSGDDSALGSFYIMEAVQIIELLLLGMRIFLTFAVFVTLLVGAAGVMNVMFVIVTERTREIGLRKAIGASNGAIFAQFVAESVAITFVSGLVGALLGVATVLAAQAALGQGTELASTPQLDPGSFATIVATMMVVGVGAGVLPAIRAARIDPAVSLRAT